MIFGRALAAAAAAALVCSSVHAAPKGRRGSGRASSYMNWLEVIEVDGVLKANGRPVRAGYYISPGAQMEVVGEGRVVVRLGDAGAVQLRGPATFEFGGSAVPGMSLTRGSLLAALPFLREQFQVRSRNLVAAVRGTDFYMDVKGRRGIYLCVCEGTVDVYEERSDGYQKSITADHHKGVGYNIAGGLTLESDHAMEGHTDEEIAELKALAAERRKQ